MTADLQSLLNHLVAGVREETLAGERTLELLERQQHATIARDHAGRSAATRTLADHLATAPQRSARRERILARLAAAWGVPASVLTLSSVATRIGARAEPLLAERSQLRRVMAGVVRENKKTAALLLLHRRVVREVLDLFLTDEDGNPVESAGTLVDAEA